MSDASTYVAVSYGLTLAVVSGYAVFLMLRARRLRRREESAREAPAPSRPAAAGLTAEVSHV